MDHTINCQIQIAIICEKNIFSFTSFHSKKYKFNHTFLQQWLTNDDVRLLDVKKLPLQYHSVKKNQDFHFNDTIFRALFLSLRVGNYMWKLCHLINKAFFFTLHILLYRIPTKLERYERCKFGYFLKRVCNRPLKILLFGRFKLGTLNNSSIWFFLTLSTTR